MKTLLKIAASLLVVLAIGIVLTSSYTTSKVVESQETTVTSDFNTRYHITMPPIPDTVVFCGEQVPLDNWEVKERLEREILSNTYWQSNTLLLLKRSGKYFDEIDAILKEEDVPTDFKYLAVAESGLTNAVSPAGARGVWQFMKTTGTSYGLQITSEVDERYHLEKATRAACEYLKKAKEELGSWTLAASAYNRGLPGISRDLKNQKVDSYFDLYLNSETSRYVFRIIAFKLIMENPEAYGFKLSDDQLYTNTATEEVKVDTTINDLADFAITHNTNYKTIKLLNPWLRDDHLMVKTGEVYHIAIPQ